MITNFVHVTHIVIQTQIVRGKVTILGTTGLETPRMQRNMGLRYMAQGLHVSVCQLINP